MINSIRETSRRILRLLVKDDCAGSSRFAKEVKSYWEDNPERFQARFYSRVRLKQNVFASLIDWLAWTGWESGIDARPALCVGVQRILAQLARRDEAGDTPSQLQAGSLVARYLILLEATGVDARDRLAVLNATSGSDPVRLPSYWPPPPWSNARCWRRATAEDCARFIDNFDRFWSDQAWCRTRRRRLKSLRSRSREEMHGALDHFGYQVPSSPQTESARIVRDEVEGTTEPIFLSRRQAVALAHLTYYDAQLVPDRRPLLSGLRILEAGLSVPTLSPLRRLASLALAHLALLHGISIDEGLDIALSEARDIAPGEAREAASSWIDRDSQSLHLCIGKETKKGLVGRVPQQIVRLPLAPATRAIFQKLIGSGGAKSLASYYGPNCLDQVRADLGDLARLQKDSYKQLGRLHHAWRYVAVLPARLSPAVIALMCGCVVGPFRSDSNYLTVTEQTLFDCVFRVHREIFRLAGHSLTVSYQSPTADKLVGKCVQSLTEWARSAARTLEQVSEPAEVAAAHQWLSAVHGRRPTADLPDPGAHILHCGNSPMLVIADKNHFGGRRIRLVPLSSAASKLAGSFR